MILPTIRAHAWGLGELPVSRTSRLGLERLERVPSPLHGFVLYAKSIRVKNANAAAISANTHRDVEIGTRLLIVELPVMFLGHGQPCQLESLLLIRRRDLPDCNRNRRGCCAKVGGSAGLTRQRPRMRPRRPGTRRPHPGPHKAARPAQSAGKPPLPGIAGPSGRAIPVMPMVTGANDDRLALERWKLGNSWPRTLTEHFPMILEIWRPDHGRIWKRKALLRIA